ncbi:hypothetical protein AK812_SmicGene9476 [Symbiodinium microadriaticum]|uniref:Uncharacterized protein n=1 Tax=Symbiodinium microadriaticum TaxID=2951 RepID=A0A1Q9EIF0_SYMMI|nr:hypothetical protein AK812_SmicGene9476 [Symbiodinium microadriaticum]CAE7687762.1 unnamed protein product [Symbiodinium sp. KB8]
MSEHRAEDLTFDQMKTAVVPLVCRALPQPVSLDLPVGIFNPLILPITLLQLHDNPLVNMFDVISNHSLDIDFAYLEKAFFDANRDSNFSYSTNAIEAKWSLLKRWAHRKLGGKLPSHSDRVKWHRLINEYQGRCILKRLPDSGE